MALRPSAPKADASAISPYPHSTNNILYHFSPKRNPAPEKRQSLLVAKQQALFRGGVNMLKLKHLRLTEEGSCY